MRITELWLSVSPASRARPSASSLLSAGTVAVVQCKANSAPPIAIGSLGKQSSDLMIARASALCPSQSGGWEERDSRSCFYDPLINRTKQSRIAACPGFHPDPVAKAHERRAWHSLIDQFDRAPLCRIKGARSVCRHNNKSASRTVQHLVNCHNFMLVL